MTTTKIWVDGDLVFDETFDLDTNGQRKEASDKTLAVIDRARRETRRWRIEIYEPHAPARQRTWFQTSTGHEGWIPENEGGYLSTFLRFAVLVAATALLLVPFILLDLAVILAVIGTVSIVRTRRLRRAQAAWRAQLTRRIRP